MTAFKYDARFSSRPEVMKVEQKFGLPGMARMVKLLELLAFSPKRSEGVIEMPLSDWEDALQQGHILLLPFLTYLQRAEWLTVDMPAAQGDPLRATLRYPAQYMLDASPTPVGPVLFEEPAQWGEWFINELTSPGYVVDSPETQQIFRHWCATNVTVKEVEAAIERAIKARQGPTPVALHEHLKVVRKLKIESARS